MGALRQLTGRSTRALFTLCGGMLALGWGECAYATGSEAGGVQAWNAAVEVRLAFEAEPDGAHTRLEYSHVMDGFRAIYHADPADAHAARAVAQVAELLAEQGRELDDRKSLRDAAGQYEFLAHAYPASGLAPESLDRAAALLAPGVADDPPELRKVQAELARDYPAHARRDSPAHVAECARPSSSTPIESGPNEPLRQMSKPTNTVLIIDDEVKIRRFLRAGFELHGGFSVKEADNAIEGLKTATFKLPDLIILDLELPDMYGADVLERIRSWSNVPVIILSVGSNEEEKVRLLQMGADDYIVKPFGIAELLARSEAALRRYFKSANENPVVTTGPLSIDLAGRTVRLNGSQIRLTPQGIWLAAYAGEARGAGGDA